MPRRLDKTLTDYLVIAVSPALIMTMIGSLVFFLLEVLYRGNYSGRLHWIMALFVMATVLIGRISIEEGAERAMLFSLPLALVTILAINKFVSIKGASLGPFTWIVNWSLLGLIWWCAHKLTWDCTLIDETERDPGEGLLEAVGLEKSAAAAAAADTESGDDMQGTTSADTPLPPWWRRLVERHRRPHAPGVWVIYFSLAALPLFGLGQWFIPVANTAGRQYAFRLLCVYVGSGLGLLLATSFLGLRRYLRQRRQAMPTAMAGLWTSTGCSLIVGLLVFAALLPRPSAEYPISRLPFTVGSPDRRPSRHGLGNDGPETDEDAQKKRAAKDRQAEVEVSEAGDEQAGPSENEQGQEKQGKKSDENAADNGSETSDNDTQDEATGKPEASGETQTSEDPQTSENSEATGESEASKESPSQEPASTGNEEESTEPSEPKADRQVGHGGQPHRPPPMLPHVLPSLSAGWLTTLVKWLVYAGLIYCLWYYRHELTTMAGDLLRQLREFWQNMFGRESASEEIAAKEDKPRPPRPFASFADPFATGMADRHSPEELVRYSFEALEAFANERGHAREPDQTPHEFARNVGVCCATLSNQARHLADLYCRVAYARGVLPPDSTGHLRRLWEQLGRETAVT